MPQFRLYFARPLALQNLRIREMARARFSLELISDRCQRSLAEVTKIVEGQP